MNIRIASTVLCLSLVVGGCARLPEQLPNNPKDQVDLDIPRPTGIAAAPWPAQEWWRSANDPELNRLVQIAFARNPDLRAAAAKVLLAQADVGAARSRLLPHFDADFALTQQYFSAQGLHLSANGTSNTFGALNPIDIHYHVDLWGQDRDLVRAARGRLAMNQAEAAQARLLVSTAVVVQYFALEGDRRLLQQTEHLHTLQEQAKAVAEGGFQQGLFNASQIHAEDLALAESAQRIAKLQAAIAAEKHALAALCGEGPSMTIGSATITKQALSPALGLPKNLPLRLLARRPDIVAARWAVQAAAAEVGAARAAFYPNINLRLLAGWNSIHLGDLFNPGNFAHAVGPVITLPIFEGGALRAHLRAQNAVFLAAQDRYRSTLLAALRQIADRLSTAQKLARQERAQRHAAAAAQAQWELRQQAWRQGLSDALPSIAAEITCVQVRQRRTAITTARWQNWALLESALGGGYRHTIKDG
ncbi:MAG: efflux transporter outer membrane subunit [Acidithiobacillus caldus]|uniref:efflux transporter outer membrane subunit n=1 Tax=Acidithiobacillus caldus TaxID=33059 RepID=UPI001D02D487|nr:efflux transporter outer membrane subunit [Acidithiobacillus caldus]WMT47070.1 MAG: efflux transporter outer membrane subunit [Acidithiobacillus caldus]